jgi:hypothetical protein
VKQLRRTTADDQCARIPVPFNRVAAQILYRAGSSGPAIKLFSIRQVLDHGNADRVRVTQFLAELDQVLDKMVGPVCKTLHKPVQSEIFILRAGTTETSRQSSGDQNIIKIARLHDCPARQFSCKFD